MSKKLTPKQKKFADYYIQTGNGAEAARLAGYKGKNHDNIGTENLRKVAIKEYIDERLEKKDKKTIADQNEVLQFFTEVMRGKIKDIVVDKEGNEHEVGTTLKDRHKAADSLAKRYNLYNNKIEIDLADLLKGTQTMAELINNPVKNRTLNDLEDDNE